MAAGEFVCGLPDSFEFQEHDCMVMLFFMRRGAQGQLLLKQHAPRAGEPGRKNLPYSITHARKCA